jgi:UDP-glucuronate decarboxylase
MPLLLALLGSRFGAWGRVELMPASLTRNLITGGAGFVGSHLVDRLMQAGEEVICLDNYFTGRKANIAQWIGHPRFELIRHDVTEPIKLEVDRIWHLACPASPVHYQFNPIKTAKTSFLGTYNMLGLARRVGARLLLASTRAGGGSFRATRPSPGLKRTLLFRWLAPTLHS